MSGGTFAPMRAKDLPCLRGAVAGLLLLAACSGPRGADDGTRFDLADVATCTVPPTDGIVDGECCEDALLRPLPTEARTVIDLRDVATLDGTCGRHDPRVYGPPSVLVLPQDPAAYPVKLITPALAGADPACATVCGGNEPAITRFGIAISTAVRDPVTGDITSLLVGSDTGRVLHLTVAPPWRFVSGGCGEACAWPCLDGYQEYGSPHGCMTIAHGDLGLATDDPRAPSVEAVIELAAAADPFASFGACCPYR